MMEKEFEKRIAKKIKNSMYGINYHSREEEMRSDYSKDVDLESLCLKLDEIRPMLYKFSNKLGNFKGKVDKNSRLELVRDLVRNAARDLFDIYNIAIYLSMLE